jgi:hypothetical protein
LQVLREDADFAAKLRGHVSNGILAEGWRREDKSCCGEFREARIYPHGSG